MISVRREELFDDEVAAGHEVSLNDKAENELRERLNAQLSELLDFGLPATEASTQQTGSAETAEPEAVAAEEPDELAFEFRLFRDEAPTHTVIIDQNDDKPEARGDGGFIVPKRPNSYYLAGEPDPGSMEKFRFAAVTPDYLFADAKRRRWGLEKPWRVTHITITAKPLGKSSSTSTTDDDVLMTDAKRKRPGKKRRIILRTREKAKKEKEEAARKHLESKEEHLKAKKQRLNREKKLKRRAKEKAKKTASGDVGKGDDNVSDSDSEA